MSVLRRSCACVLVFSFIVTFPMVEGTSGNKVVEVYDPGQPSEELGPREQELERLRKQVTVIQPAVAELTGFPEGEPVEVAVMSRAELREYVIWSTEMGYPDDELIRRSRSLAMIGLLPEDYDLVAGMIDLVGEQAAGLYDPYGKAFNGILNLSPVLMAPQYQRLIISHELTHALQDRMIDILAHAEVGLTDIDYEYGLRAAIEGMATMVMLAYMEDIGLDETPDARSYMRNAFGQTSRSPGMEATARTPEYLKELLISPYAEGGAFCQAWYRANPDLKLADLLRNIPASSEQVLHPEKYLEPDEPTPIDLAGVESKLPEGWDPFYTNTLGEFDLLTLFSIHDETSADAADMAAGWDGLRFQVFEDERGQLVLLGCSVWDSELDAEEFEVGFSAVLEEIREPGTFTVALEGQSVGFIVGCADPAVRERLVAAVTELM
jgi:hypothetical protein